MYVVCGNLQISWFSYTGTSIAYRNQMNVILNILHVKGCKRSNLFSCHLLWVICLFSFMLSFLSLLNLSLLNTSGMFWEIIFNIIIPRAHVKGLRVDGNPFAFCDSISSSINDFCLWYLFLFAASADNQENKVSVIIPLDNYSLKANPR